MEMTVNRPDNSKTKTYKYLFLPILYFYHSEKTINAFESMTIDNVYIADKEEKYQPLQCIFHIVVDNNEAFYSNIDVIKESNFYQGHYSRNKAQIVILFKGFKGKSTKHFLQSEYSKMYNEGTFLDIIKKPLSTKYAFEYRVLNNDPTLKEEIINELNLNDARILNTIQELDSKIVLEEELL